MEGIKGRNSFYVIVALMITCNVTHGEAGSSTAVAESGASLCYGTIEGTWTGNVVLPGGNTYPVSYKLLEERTSIVGFSMSSSSPPIKQVGYRKENSCDVVLSSGDIGTRYEFLLSPHGVEMTGKAYSDGIPFPNQIILRRAQ